MVLPENDVYCPATHPVHTVAATVTVHFPVSQDVHPDEPSVLEYAELQQSKHLAALVAPIVVEYFPAKQLMHDSLPAVLLYFPAAHAVHTVFNI